MIDYREVDGSERRESERAIAYWERKRQEFGENLTLASLDLGRIASQDWSYRFLISIDRIVRRSTLVLYGGGFARLLNLPVQVTTGAPVVRQLPARYVDVFLRGCADAQNGMTAVRVEGERKRYDGRIEQYRAAFIPIGIRPKSLTYFAFGAFNSRIVEAAAAA